MTVVVGFAPTDLGRAALEAAVHEAALRGVGLLVVNSATGAAYADKGIASPAELQEVEALARERGVAVEVHQVGAALDVADTLLAEAERVVAELVVIGVRSRSRAGKFLLGSTAQTVLLRAACPVLAVKDPALRP